MRSFFACLLAWFLASLGGCLASQKRPTFQGPKSVQVLYSGDVRGEVEPCGCVTGQKGGIPRRAGFIRQALQKNPATLVFDTGNAFNGSDVQSPFLGPLIEKKARFIVEAMNEMGYSAYTPGVYDLALGKKRLSNLLQGASFAVLESTKEDGLPNAKRDLFGDLFGIGMNVGVVGFALPENPSRDVLEAFEKGFSAAVKSLKKKSAGLAIVLYSGPYRHLDSLKLQGVPLNTLVLLSYEGAWWPKPRVLGDGRVLLVSIPKEGQHMGQVELVLSDPSQPFVSRLEWMFAFYKRRMFEAALQKKALKNRHLVEQRLELARAEIEGLEKKNLFDWQVVPLDWRFTEDPKMKAAADALKARIQQEYARQLASATTAAEREKNGGKALSDKNCKPCHQEAWSVWSNTPHAKAFATLIEKKADANPECVACHSTGFDKELRLLELKDGAAKPNVLCSACHGHRPLHLKDPKAYPMETGARMAVCIGCHDSKNSPGFVFGPYIQAIRCDRERQKGSLARILNGSYNRPL